MVDFHKAIRAIHTNVLSIDGDTQDDIQAYDNNGNAVTVDWTQVNAWNDPTEYQIQRALEYPDFKEYLDGIVKGDQAQIDKYIADCQAVKDKYPKPTE